MNDIEMELWIERQQGLQAMYQDRVANPNRVKTMEEDISEQMVVAQKSMSATKYGNPYTEIGYNPAASNLGKVIGILNKTELFIGMIGAAALAITGPGFFVGLIEAAFTAWFYKIIESWVKILDMEALLSNSDRAMLVALVAETKSLANRVKKYDDWKDVPPGLKREIRDNVKRNYVAKNRMAIAVEKAKATYQQKAKALGIRI